MLTTSIFHWIRFWPPFLVAGLRVKNYSREDKFLEVEMRLRFWNWNHEKSHFGGSLYSMTDPFYALLIRENVETPVEVWVKSAQIRFKKPGRGVVQSRFQLTHEKLSEIKESLLQSKKSEPEFFIEVKDSQGNVVAEVQQVVTVKLKA